jgi:hypothetical protein
MIFYEVDETGNDYVIIFFGKLLLEGESKQMSTNLEDLDDWDDEKAHELYITISNSMSGKARSNAIHGLAKLARDESANAAYALRLIARSSISSVDRELASKELSKA